jgi:fatty acid desaturase
MSDATATDANHRLKPLTPAMLRELSVRSDRQGALRSVSHYAAILLLGALIWNVCSTHGALWALPLMVAQGYVVAFLFMAVHETAHKTAFRSRGSTSRSAISRPSSSGCPTSIIACSIGTITATPRIRPGIPS